MIQRRVKWKRRVTVQNGSMQAGESLGKNRGLEMGDMRVWRGRGLGILLSIWPREDKFHGVEDLVCVCVNDTTIVQPLM